MGDKDTYLVTNVYGPQRMDDKLRFLDSLMELRDRHVDVPWILCGDFNMIRSLSNKKRVTRTLSRDSTAFQTFIDNMKLVDIDMRNGLFTWNNKRGGESQVALKLDRFIILEDIMLTNKEMIVRIIPFGGSDHWPIQLEVQGIGTPKKRPLRFENSWLTHPDFISNIPKWWKEELHIQGTSMFQLHKRLKHIKLRLKDWNKNEFGNIFIAKKVVEDKMWETILDREHFIRDLTGYIPRLVTREDNFNLNRLVIEEEVSEVIKEMQNGKAPSPDGFNVDFFKSCWNIVKLDILNIVEDSRLNKNILKVLNTSFISLIPKQDNAQTLDRLRPIALCNVAYMIISKFVANRLKPLLPTLVYVEQPGYVEGR
eukprot:PITA_07867